MKNIILRSSLVVFIGLVVVVGVKAADNAAVTATVTAQNVAVSLSQSTFNYGTISNNTASSTLQLWLGAGIVATNDGNINEDFDINGSNTTGDTPNWTLDSTTSENHYIHQFCNDTDNDCSTPPTNYTGNELTTSPTPLDTVVAASGSTAFQLRITTPNPSTNYTQQSASVTVTASAS